MNSSEQKEPLGEASLATTLETLRLNDFNTSANPHTQKLQTDVSDIADASRTNISLRIRLASPEILRSLLKIVSTSLAAQDSSPLLATAALRCVGNACIDNSDARSIIIESHDSSWASMCLTNDDAGIVKTSLKVIYNLCVDHEPAQKWAYVENLHVDVIALLSDGKPAEACVELDAAECILGLELLFWITNQRPASSTASQPSESTPAKDESLLPARLDLSPLTLHKLLRLPYLYAPDLDGEDFAMLGEICLTYIRDPVVQRQICKHKFVQYVWRMLQDNEQKLQHIRKEVGEDEGEADEIKVLVPLSSSLTWCLSDIAAIRSEVDEPTGKGVMFEKSFLHGLIELIIFLGTPEDEQVTSEPSWQKCVEMTQQGTMVRIDPIPHRLESLPGENVRGITKALPDELHLSPQMNMQDLVLGNQSMSVAACQFLANVLWCEGPQPNDQSWTRTDLFASLWSTISVTQNSELLHSAAGLLVQLSRLSLEFREAMAGDENALSALNRLCRHSTPPVKQDGARLLRALGKDSAANQARFAELAKEVVVSMANDSETADVTDAT